MNSRQRFACAMAHRAGDRVPVDLGGTTLTSMSSPCQASLRAYLGFSGDTIPTNTQVDERILEWAGTDFRSVGHLVDLPVRRKGGAGGSGNVDCWGLRRVRVGQYDEIVDPPLRGASVADLSDFDWPEARIDEDLLVRWQRQAKTLHDDGRYVVIGEHPVYGILELGCWMCGYDEFLARLAGDRDFVRVFFDKVFAIQMPVIEQYYTVLGPYIDLTTSGDDFGMQTGPLISPKMFEELIVPYFSARIARTKELGRCYYWHHSCGSIAKLLDQIIGCGVDILNPIQTSAAEMDPGELKARYADRLVFWGAVDVQDFLPRATPEQVRERVRQLVDTLGAGGGYVTAPAHNMQDDIPPENIVGWIETIHR